MRYILCIDDEPSRYDRLARSVPNDVVVLVTCRLEEVKFYLYTYRADIIGVCLDHDMPFADGQYFASHVLNELSIPVAVVSQNPMGAAKIIDILEEWATPTRALPAAHREEWVRDIKTFFRLNERRLK